MQCLRRASPEVVPDQFPDTVPGTGNLMDRGLGTALSAQQMAFVRCSPLLTLSTTY